MADTNRNLAVPAAELLESRRLLAATIVDGVLVGTGTNGSDVISVRVLTGEVVVTINGTSKQFDLDDFTGIRLEGSEENDTFELVDTLLSPEVLETTIIGGAGNDRVALNNSGLPSALDGGAGTDTVDLEFFTSPTVTSVNMRQFAGVENLANVDSPMLWLIIGNDLHNYIDASGNDGLTIVGSGGNDTLIGGRGDDNLEGEDGRDLLVGNDGDDTLDGGAGIDTLVGGAGNNTVRNGEQLVPDPTSPTIAVDAGILIARGTVGPDTFSLRRHLGDNVIVSVNSLSREFDLDDLTGVQFEGFSGNDVFLMVDALVGPPVRNATVLGGAGNDRVDYSARRSALYFNVDPIGSSVHMGAQVDAINGVETFVGGSEGDRFVYAQRDDQMRGKQFSYLLEGRSGNDVFVDGISQREMADAFGSVIMRGGDGDDRFVEDANQRAVRDSFYGESGNDSVSRYDVGGRADGGPGIDTMHFLGSGGDLGSFPGFESATATAGADMPIRLTGTEGPNQLSISGSGTIEGLGGDDTILGSDEADTLSGGGGDDLLFGNAGDDELDGGIGNDAVDGGPGNDASINAEIAPGPAAISVVNRILTARGTWGAELITIERTGTDSVIVRVNETSLEFAMADFDGVLLRGNGGHDRIIVQDPLTGPVVRRVTLEGGDGNDTLMGNDQEDVLRGGNGNDELQSVGPGDVVLGEAGNDTLRGAANHASYLDGGAGNDTLFSENHLRDTVRGGGGSDVATVDPLDDVGLVEKLTVLSIPPLVRNPVGHGVVAQADGKVIIVGSTDPGGDGNTDFLVARFHADGSIDRSFGLGGIVRTDVSGGGADVAYGVTVGRNGKIIVVGSTDESGEIEAAVVRYHPDGTLDTSFSDDGMRTTGYAERADIAYDVLIDAAGRIVFAGASGSDFLIGRLSSNGTSDTQFNGDGLDLVGFGRFEEARGVALLPNGQIVAGGYTTSGIGGSDFAVALYDPETGTRVPSFGLDGKRTVDLSGRNDAAWGVAVDSRGRIVLGGTTSIPAVAAVRLNPTDGSLDTSFAADGIRINRVDIVPGTPFQQVPATGGGVFISSGDKVNFAGAWRGAGRPLPEWHIARVPSWGGLERDSGGGPPPFAAIAPAPDGDWIVAREDFSLLLDAWLGGPTGLPIVLGSDGSLVVRGTAGDDVIDIRRTGAGDVMDVMISVNTLSWQLNMADVTAVRLHGGSGNDRITITDLITDGSTMRLEGDDGDDTLIGNDGDDALEGGDGNDHLEGAGGRDTLSDVWGNDSMFGGTGEDSMDGGYGDDFLDATDGASGDTVEGGPGTDTAEVNPGDSAVNVEIFA